MIIIVTLTIVIINILVNVMKTLAVRRPPGPRADGPAARALQLPVL